MPLRPLAGSHYSLAGVFHTWYEIRAKHDNGTHFRKLSWHYHLDQSCFSAWDKEKQFFGPLPTWTLLGVTSLSTSLVKSHQTLLIFKECAQINTFWECTSWKSIGILFFRTSPPSGCVKSSVFQPKQANDFWRWHAMISSKPLSHQLTKPRELFGESGYATPSTLTSLGGLQNGTWLPQVDICRCFTSIQKFVDATSPKTFGGKQKPPKKYHHHQLHQPHFHGP